METEKDSGKLRATTTPKLFCFVLMPFDSQSNDVYQIGIKESCMAAGAYCERVDEQIFHESILGRIYNQIAKADVVIADMTGRNPNVFYEVGYAHALGKRTILLTKDSNDIPFDLKHFPHIVYENKLTYLRDELTKRVQWFVAHPQTSNADSQIGIELFLKRERIGAVPVIREYKSGGSLDLEMTIFNNSPSTFENGRFTLGLITPDMIPALLNDANSMTLPDGNVLHMMSGFPTLFPSSYTSREIVLLIDSKKVPPQGSEILVVFRVFTQQGTRDFELVLKRAL